MSGDSAPSASAISSVINRSNAFVIEAPVIDPASILAVPHTINVHNDDSAAVPASVMLHSEATTGSFAAPSPSIVSLATVPPPPPVHHHDHDEPNAPSSFVDVAPPPFTMSLVSPHHAPLPLPSVQHLPHLPHQRLPSLAHAPLPPPPPPSSSSSSSSMSDSPLRGAVIIASPAPLVLPSSHNISFAAPSSAAAIGVVAPVSRLDEHPDDVHHSPDAEPLGPDVVATPRDPHHRPDIVNLLVLSPSVSNATISGNPITHDVHIHGAPLPAAARAFIVDTSDPLHIPPVEEIELSTSEDSSDSDGEKERKKRVRMVHHKIREARISGETKDSMNPTNGNNNIADAGMTPARVRAYLLNDDNRPVVYGEDEPTMVRQYSTPDVRTISQRSAQLVPYTRPGTFVDMASPAKVAAGGERKRSGSDGSNAPDKVQLQRSQSTPNARFGSGDDATAVPSPHLAIDIDSGKAGASATIGTPLQLPDLDKLPAHLHIDKQRFYSLLRELVQGMGIEMDQATKALTYCEARSVEDAVDFLFPHAGGRYHHFTRFPLSVAMVEDEKQIDVFLCLQCGLREKDHPPVPGGAAIAGAALEDADFEDMMPFVRSARLRVDVAAQALAEAAAEEKKRLAAVAEGKLTCDICTDYNFTDADFAPAVCGHKFCRGCVVGFLESSINGGQVKDLRCMHADCRRVMDEKEIEGLVSAAVWTKFVRFTEQIRLASDPQVRFCPRPNCGEVMRGSNRQPHLKCGKCAYEMCWKCNKPWHGSLSCDKVARDEFDLWVKGNDVRACPRCKTIIHKTEGCNHMTCGRCRSQFCWLCGARYTAFHYMPFNLLGCAGLQFTRDTWSCGKLVAYRIAIFILFWIALPFAIAFGFPIVCVLYWWDRHDRYHQPRYRCALAVLIFLLGMVGNVIVAPLALGLGPIAIFIAWCVMRYHSYGSRNIAL